LRALLRILGKIIKTLLAAGLLYAVSVVVLSLWPTSPKEHQCDNEHTVYVGDNGLHLDFILPQSQLPDKWLKTIPIMRDAPFVSLGWGDQEFYINTPEWSDLTVGVAIRATLLNSPAAIHLTQHQQINPNWISVSLCPQQYQALITYIDHTFIQDPGPQIIENSGYSNYDIFYRAQGSYHLLNTCNNWVNKGLKKADVQTSIWSPFIYGVNYHLSR